MSGLNYSEQELESDPKYPNGYFFRGKLDYINSLRTYKKRLPYIECGVDCGYKITIQTEVPWNLLIKPGMSVSGHGLMEFDFLSIDPCNSDNKSFA